MVKKLVSNEPVSLAGGVDFLPGESILMIDKMDAAAEPTKPILRNYVGLPLVMWGTDNNYPKRVIEMAMQSPELLALIDFMTTVLYGDGVGYEVYAGKDNKGTHTWKPGYDPEVEEWMNMNDIQNYFLELVMDQVWFNHGFTECIKNKKSNYIAQIAHQEAAFCRFGKQNPVTGYNDKVYINANWPYGSVNDEFTTPVPVLDVKDAYAAEKFLKSQNFKSVYPTNYPSPGSLIYQLPGWHALFSSKWFDISKLIPILKHALMKYQMTIKYLMEVPEEFWKIQARDKNMSWDTMTPTERAILKKGVKKEMDKFLTGAENTGKTFMTTFGWDKINKVKIPGVSITVLDDKLQDGKYIMDSKEASGQFARAFTIPQPLMGPISAGDIGAGSGSDARIHWNMLNARMKSRKVRNLGALNFAGRCNGWQKRLPGFRFCVKDIVMDTLDVNHSTANPKQNTTPTDGNADQ